MTPRTFRKTPDRTVPSPAFAPVGTCEPDIRVTGPRALSRSPKPAHA